LFVFDVEASRSENMSIRSKRQDEPHTCTTVLPEEVLALFGDNSCTQNQTVLPRSLALISGEDSIATYVIRRVSVTTVNAGAAYKVVGPNVCDATGWELAS
jgi:hypothetical protein